MALGAVIVLAFTVQTVGHAQQAEMDYTIQPGDTLSSISLATGIPIDRIAGLNGIADPDFILAGSTLLLGGGLRPTESAPGVTYVVRPGDTLSGIAAANGVSVSAVAAANGIADPDWVLDGAVLKLPSARSEAAAGALLGADWMPSPNYWPGRPAGPPIALVIHTMDGSLVGSAAHFLSLGSSASAHFGVGLDGRVHKYVEIGDRAWANGILEPGHRWPGQPEVNPNDLSVSIETEDLGNPGQRVTEAQFQATLAIGRGVIERYPRIKYLVAHRAISPTTRENDPGDRWVASGRLDALAKALGLTPIV